MNERIIYPNDNGGVSIVIPSGEVSIEQVIAQSIPAGKPYKIINAEDQPTDRTFRNAWEYQE
jgi:hypothetical protein